jgi:hypothetical protein
MEDSSSKRSNKLQVSILALEMYWAWTDGTIGYATPPPGNQWQQPPPPNPTNPQLQYATQGQQTAAASGYNPGVYGGMPGGQTQLPGPVGFDLECGWE